MKGQFVGREFFLNELYNHCNHVGQIHRLTRIKPVGYRHLDTTYSYYFTFTLVINLTGEGIPTCGTSTMTPDSWYHIPLIELMTLRTKLDDFIIEEAWLRGMA